MGGAKSDGLPGAVLFACSLNAVRSPMASALMRHLLGHAVRVESVGVHAGSLDPFAVEAMAELGIEITGHRPRRFEDLEEPEDRTFDLVVSLSPEAHHKALEFTRASGAPVEYWPTFDPTACEGSREQRLDAYRAVRDTLFKRIRERFASGPPPGG